MTPFLCYYKARLKTNLESYARDIYITDALKILSSNTAEAFGGQSITVRYAEILEPKKEESAEEIKERIKGKINGRI